MAKPSLLVALVSVFGLGGAVSFADARSLAPTTAPLTAPTASHATASADSTRTNTSATPTAVATSHILTQLSWVFGDDNVLPDATAKSAPPAPAMGERWTYELLGDALVARPRDRSNWLLWTSSVWLAGYLPRLTTGAELALAFDLTPRGPTAEARPWFQDAGTYLALRYALASQHSLELRGYPIDADTLRIGYLDALSWGKADVDLGESIFPRASGVAPGVRLAYRGPAWVAFAAMKTAQILERSQAGTTQAAASVAESNYAGFAGLEWQPHPFLTVGAAAAYVEQGRFPSADLFAERAFSVAVAGRVVVARHLTPSDLLEPRWRFGGLMDAPFEMGLAPAQGSAPGWLISFQAIELQQRLRSFETFGQTRFQNATGAALQANWLLGPVRLAALLMARSPSFVVRYGPSLVPFQTLPTALSAAPAYTAVASFGLSFWNDRLRPEIQLGVEQPASLTSTLAGQSQTLVLRESRARSIVQANQTLLTLHARAGLRAALSPAMAVLGWVQYRSDNPAVEGSPARPGDPAGAPAATSAELLGFGLAGQVRF